MYFATGLLFFVRMYYWHLRNARTLSVGAANSGAKSYFLASTCMYECMYVCNVLFAAGVNAQFIFEFILLGMHTWNLAFFPFTVAISW